MQSIKRLPRGVHSSLRSSIILFDLPRVIEELVYNSIDAGANKVDVAINVKACFVKVEDDGCGITRDELVALGEKYATSKYHHMSGDAEPSTGSFGCKGEALGSLSDIALVEVRTKARGRPNSYCKIIKGSKCLYLGIDDQREVVGTTVIVREIFYNQPVRRKYMQSSPKRVLHSVKKCVLRAALVHPQISFRLLDMESEDELLYTIPSSSPLSLVSDGFGNDVSSCLHEIASLDQNWILSGHISGPTDAFSTKAFQYLYINSRYVSKGPIHNMLNSLAASFQSYAAKRKDEFPSRKRQKTAGYPAYLLNLCCPQSSYDLNFEPSKTVVEFKDLHNVLVFFEQAITNYWKQLILQSPEEKTAVDRTGISLKSEGTSGMGFLKCCSTWKKKESIEFCGSSHQQNEVEDVNASRSLATLSKDLCSVSVDFKPHTRNIGYSEWAADALPQISSIAPNDLKLGDNQIHSIDSDIPFLLEDHGLLDVTTAVRKKSRIGNLMWGNRPSDNFGSSEDVTTKSVLIDNPQVDINAEGIQYRKPSFDTCNRPSMVSCDFLENKSNREAQSLADSSFGIKFDGLNEDCLMHEVTKAIDEISYPETSGFNDGVCHEDCGPSRRFCSVIKKSTKNRKSEGSDGYESYPIVNSKQNMQEMWGNDYMNGHSDLDLCHKFSHPFFLPEACSDKRTCLELDIRSDESFDHWHCGKMDVEDKDFKFSWDRFNKDSPVSYRKTQLCNDFKLERNKDFGGLFNELMSEGNWISCKSKFGASLPFTCSPEINITDCHLNPVFSQMPNDKMMVEELSNQLSCLHGRTSQPCKGRSRRGHSAPPFYRGKCKFSRLNDYLTMMGGEINNCQPCKSSADTKHSPDVDSHMNATQPIPEPTGSMFSELNFRETSNRKEKTDEMTCSDELEHATTDITKWRADSVQPTILELSHASFECNYDILSISSGPLHLSGASLVPECIDKNCFEEARVLRQLDSKYIPVIARETLIIVDQHAADERIRLEELRSKVLSGEGRGNTYLDSEEELVLPEMGFQLFQKYAEQIQEWGWISDNFSHSSEPFKKNMNILKRNSRVITLVAVPCILGINLTGRDLAEYIEQLVETDGSSTLPPSVRRILNFKACRGAIMFGDSLLPSECSLIIEELKATSLCFQCAHGRPTTVPILNIASLHDELARLEMQNGGPSETWHGLSHHRPSLERAQMRLDRLKRLRNG